MTRPFRDAFTEVEFRALFVSSWVSVLGDQCARVALSVLVYERTSSAGWAGVTYALTFVPDLLGGPLTAGLADRYPRRRVMIVTDVLRAGVVAIMAIPGVPLVVMGMLLVTVQLMGAPHGAARAALLAQVLPGARYVGGQAASMIVAQLAQVMGFVGGGALVALVGTTGALLADGATFGVSVVLVALWVRPRAAPVSDEPASASWWAHLRAGTRLVWTDLRLRTVVAAACVSGFYIAGEAVAVPLAAQMGGGPLGVGLLLGAYPAGTVVGMLVIVRVPDRVRVPAMPVLVVAACLPLIACAAQPGLAVTIGLFAASGAASAYHVVASTMFVLGVPDHQRGQAYGLAVTALRVSQGLGVVGAGMAADHLPATDVVAGAGALGVLAGLCVVWMWRRAGGAPAPVVEPTAAGGHSPPSQ